MNIALILSGGSGSRMHLSQPKQYLEISGKMIITYALQVVMGHKDIDAVQIVCSPEYESVISGQVSEYISQHEDKLKGFSKPGETRQLSIYNGLKDIAAYASRDDVVIVHDAARPLVSLEQLTACIKACSSHDGAMPVLPMKDTVYFSENGDTVSELLDRKKIYAGQAPEAFVFGKYLEANESLMPDKIYNINGSTEPAVLCGLDVAMIPGDERNFKITTQADLERFTEI
nr:2-C-methyl-D-erythritol 4-phosphate cytidylyltransferase [Lachnospiraceae bacterium]